MKKNKKIKILITGGAGFIGYHLAKNLSKECIVDLVDNLSRGKVDKDFKKLIKEKNVRLLNFDLNDKIKINSKRVFYTLNNCYSITTLVKHFFGETRSKEKVGGGCKKANATWGTTTAATRAFDMAES